MRHTHKKAIIIIIIIIKIMTTLLTHNAVVSIFLWKKRSEESKNSKENESIHLKLSYIRGQEVSLFLIVTTDRSFQFLTWRKFFWIAGQLEEPPS